MDRRFPEYGFARHKGYGTRAHRDALLRLRPLADSSPQLRSGEAGARSTCAVARPRHDPGFVHLNLHSEFSLVDGILRIGPLIERTKALGMPAVAVTDRANLFCMVRFYRAAVAAGGIKPIIGVDLPLEKESNDVPAGRLTLLAMNDSGYRQLARLLTRCYMAERSTGVPRRGSGRARLTEGAEGSSPSRPDPAGTSVRRCCTGGPGRRSAAPAPGHPCFRDGSTSASSGPAARATRRAWSRPIDLALAMGLPVVAGNDVRFLERGRFRGARSAGLHPGGSDSGRSAAPEALQRGAVPQVAPGDGGAVRRPPRGARERGRDRAPVQSGRRPRRQPSSRVPRPGGTRPRRVVRRAVAAGLRRAARAPRDEARSSRLAVNDEATYRERLDRELDIICRMGYPGYFLIVADFIRWAREQRIPVGPGRGSGAGSLVAYALGITDLDPLRYDLLFERFLNPERVSLPDFDIDFCMEGRDRVIDYVASRYSADHVAQIITFGTMAAKAVVRDVGRVLGHPYGFVDQIAKLIPVRARDDARSRARRGRIEGALRGGRRGAGRHHRSGPQARGAGPECGYGTPAASSSLQGASTEFTRCTASPVRTARSRSSTRTTSKRSGS